MSNSLLAQVTATNDGKSLVFDVHAGADLSDIAQAFFSRKENYTFLATCGRMIFDENEKIAADAFPSVLVEQVDGYPPVRYFILHTGMIAELHIWDEEGF